MKKLELQHRRSSTTSRMRGCRISSFNQVNGRWLFCRSRPPSGRPHKLSSIDERATAS
jgi:hypothetical protein